MANRLTRAVILILFGTCFFSAFGAPAESLKKPEDTSTSTKDLEASKHNSWDKNPTDLKKHHRPQDVVHSSFGEALNDLFKKLEIQDDGPYQLNRRPEPEVEETIEKSVPHPPEMPVFPYYYKGYPYDYTHHREERLRGHQNKGYPPVSLEPFGSHERFHCAENGLFYRDETTFYSCSSGHFNVLHCAPGTRNRPRRDYEKKEFTESGELISVDFCSVNLVALVPNHPNMHPDYPYY